MRLIDVIETHCDCIVKEISIALRGGKALIYSKGAVAVQEILSTEIFLYDNIAAEVKYAATSKLSEKDRQFMFEMVGCVIENKEAWSLQESLSRLLDTPYKGTSLEEMIDQTLNTLIGSNLFDKAAVLFYNENDMALKGQFIVAFPPYDEARCKGFKSLQLPLQSETLSALSDERLWPVQMEDKIFTSLDNIKTNNRLIVSPLMTGPKIYGVLVTYSDSNYEDKHFSASRSTARFISAMLSANLVYQKYNMALTSNEQASEKNKENERMADLARHTATIAHEIKNPLIAIGGFAKRLMKAINDPNLHKMAQIISTEAERLERLTADILSFSNKQIPFKENIDLFQEMQSIRMLFDRRANEDNIKLIINIEEGTAIFFDKNQFRQVIVNLIANAMNAMKGNGSVRLSIEENEKNHMLKVKDTGPGIPDEALAQIFTPFYTTCSNGTGLGLPISKKIMVNHGGDILVKTSSKGAEFTLVIPKL